MLRGAVIYRHLIPIKLQLNLENPQGSVFCYSWFHHCTLNLAYVFRLCDGQPVHLVLVLIKHVKYNNKIISHVIIIFILTNSRTIYNS